MFVIKEGTRRISPDSVEYAARARLTRTGYRRLSAIDCTFRDGTMALRGEVPSYYHKQLAQEALRDVIHVTQILNHI